ncbi:hypothetical protein [Deinococcus radiophilus]|uniref:PIG-L family deacetylase n=1 Tax=Deinococcus radiophilus TaxID=32062 RepID=A0A431W3B6_9DEIO|nr:hypothetical protein [Deinococcus radiophilus]RTR29882.1 hypothetical protein EJ104_02760 [Deinococcus radiophilus]UFA49766.1 hypothetical protein LMT64_07645 [Deinococcus radiophilus]
MNPQAYRDARTDGTKLVFIYLTAGDAGQPSMVPGRSYVLAREEGTRRSVRFMVDAGRELHGPTVRGFAKAGPHLIYRVEYGPTVSYYLRLPDGLDAPYLQELHQGERSQLKSLDSLSTYRGWNDLRTTVQRIVEYEGRSSTSLRFHLSDPDPVINEGDHHDHREASLLITELLPQWPCAAVNLYQMYNTSRLPVNMAHDDVLNQAGLFAMTESGRIDLGYPGGWEPFHKSWLGKNYVCEQSATAPTPCF